MPVRKKNAPQIEITVISRDVGSRHKIKSLMQFFCIKLFYCRFITFSNNLIKNIVDQDTINVRDGDIMLII